MARRSGRGTLFIGWGPPLPASGLVLCVFFTGTQFQFINNVPQFQTADAVTAVTAAIAQASPSVAAPDVRQLLSSVTPADGIVALRMGARAHLSRLPPIPV